MQKKKKSLLTVCQYHFDVDKPFVLEKQIELKPELFT